VHAATAARAVRTRAACAVAWARGGGALNRADAGPVIVFDSARLTLATHLQVDARIATRRAAGPVRDRAGDAAYPDVPAVLRPDPGLRGPGVTRS
jgi:hypothetical protein